MDIAPFGGPYLDVDMPEFFRLDIQDEAGRWLEWGTYWARDFIRRPDGSYFCGGYPYGALTYFRCIAHHDGYFEHVDGDGYGEVHNYRLVPLTLRGRQRSGQR